MSCYAWVVQREQGARTSFHSLMVCHVHLEHEPFRPGQSPTTFNAQHSEASTVAKALRPYWSNNHYNNVGSKS